MRLAGLEPDPHKRVAHLHRVAKIYEEGFKDARHALAALRDAMEIDPLYLPSIGELAKFFDRQSDVQSMRVHLDRTSARVRQQLDANPMDPAPYHALFEIYGWRRAPDRAAFAAGTLEWLGAADADEKTLLAKLTGRDNYPGSSLADPTLDETLFDARVPAGFRNLFRLLDEPLAKMFRADVKRLGVGRHEKLPRSGHALRDVANKHRRRPRHPRLRSLRHRRASDRARRRADRSAVDRHRQQGDRGRARARAALPTRRAASR